MWESNELVNASSLAIRIMQNRNIPHSGKVDGNSGEYDEDADRGDGSRVNWRLHPRLE